MTPLLLPGIATNEALTVQFQLVHRHLLGMFHVSYFSGIRNGAGVIVDEKISEEQSDNAECHHLLIRLEFWLIWAHLGRSRNDMDGERALLSKCVPRQDQLQAPQGTLRVQPGIWDVRGTCNLAD